MNRVNKKNIGRPNDIPYIKNSILPPLKPDYYICNYYYDYYYLDTF